MSEALTFTQLRCFLAVAELLNFRRAAEELHMTQPPLTRQIQALERSLGVELFDRSGKRVALTPAGAVLMEDASRILHALAQARANVRAAAATGRRALAVSYLESCAYDVLPGALSIFRTRHPGAHVHLEVSGTFEGEDLLLNGDVDVAFLRPPVRSTDVDLTIIRTERLVAAVPTGHRFADREIDLIDLKDEPFIAFSRTMDAGIRTTAVQACAAAGFLPRFVEKTTSGAMITGMIAEGRGIALFSEAWARIPRQGVSYARIKDANAITVLAAAVLRGRDDSLARAFVEAAVEAANTRTAA
jgi:DNA-binding transcriptional LysR family regulator